MESPTQSVFQLSGEISPLLVHLLKGVLYQDLHPELWSDMLRYIGPAREYFALIGLEIFVDESEGYAFLRQVDAADEETAPLPRLIQRRQMSYPVSLLLVLLRKKLVELDAGGSETRLILSRDQLVEMVRVFLADTSNEAKLISGIDRHINKLVDFGFLRKLKGDDRRFEVHRIIRALVDGQWLSDFNTHLQHYHDHAANLA
jgi:hypothetical protein